MVHQKNVGTIRPGRLQQERGPQIAQGRERQAKAGGRVGSITLFGDCWKFEKINPWGQFKGRGQRRSRHNQRLCIGLARREVLRQRKGAPEMPQTEGIMAIEQESQALHHGVDSWRLSFPVPTSSLDPGASVISAVCTAPSLPGEDARPEAAPCSSNKRKRRVTFRAISKCANTVWCPASARRAHNGGSVSRRAMAVASSMLSQGATSKPLTSEVSNSGIPETGVETAGTPR